MTAVRSYKRPMSAPAARTELVACSGTHFDPHVVRAFLDVSLGRLCVILGPLSWLALVPLIGRLPRALAATAGRGTSGQLGRGLRAVGIAVTAASAVTSLAVAPPRSGAATTPNAAIAPASPRTTTTAATEPAPATLPAPTIPGTNSPTPPFTPTGTDGIASTVTGVAPVVTVGTPVPTPVGPAPTAPPPAAPVQPVVQPVEIPAPPLLDLQVGPDHVAVAVRGALVRVTTPTVHPTATPDVGSLTVSQPAPRWVRQVVRSRSCGLTDGSRTA
jgi:hypothetical protein